MTESQSHEDPSKLIDRKIDSLTDWRGIALSRVRDIIRGADPRVEEAVKWRKPTNPAGVPVWECGGLICTGETYKDKIKLTFVKGAALPDPEGLFNAGFGGKVRRAIDIREADSIDAEALSGLVREAIKLNRP